MMRTPLPSSDQRTASTMSMAGNVGLRAVVVIPRSVATRDLDHCARAGVPRCARADNALRSARLLATLGEMPIEKRDQRALFRRIGFPAVRRIAARARQRD